MNVYEKWGGVMDHAFPNKSEKIKQVYAEYAEHHANIQNENGNILPLSLRALSEVEYFDHIIETNNFILSKKPTKKLVVKIKISYDDWNELKFVGINYVETCEYELLKELVRMLNILLKGASAIKVFKIVDSIYIDKENREMILTSDFKITGSREDKLKRILQCT